METRRLGSSDLAGASIGLGCNNFGGRIDAAASQRVIDAALDLGVTFFDTADIYADTRSETIIGAAIEGRRDRVVLATKFGKPIAGAAESRRGSRAYILKSAEASLKRLRTDHIDLYQMHEPDPETPIEETIAALEELVAAGKIGVYGASNYTADGLKAAQAAARKLGARGFVSSQDEYSLVSREIEAGLLPAIEAEGLSLIPYFPLAGGLLTGKYRHGERPQGRLSGGSPLGNRYLTERNAALVERLAAYAEGKGYQLLELAFAWLLAHGSVASVIAGATRPEQIAANAAAANVAPLTDGDLAAIEALGAAA